MASALACHSTRPNTSSLMPPPNALIVPIEDIAIATFHGAPPGTLRQVSGPVRIRSVSASPKDTKWGKSG